MLTWIRKKSSGLFMTVVMGVLILAFALWGVGDYFNQSSNDKLATVNGETITYQEFNNQFNTYKQQMLQQFGDGFDPTYFDNQVFQRSFLDQMINSELVRQVAKNNGYTVTAAEIRQQIEQAPAFQDENGVFDKGLYAQFLTRTNQSARTLQNKLEDEQAGAVLNEILEKTSFITPLETEKMVLLNKQTRDINYITIDPSQFVESIELTDEEINAYYLENSAQYMTEEKVSVNYIELQASDVAQDIEISESEALERFEQDKERFKKQEQRLASHILLNDDDQAQSLITEIQDKMTAGEPFAELAKTYSQDPGSSTSGGDLGWVSPGDMVEEFDQALFTMEVGTVSEPVKTQFGYHFIQLNEVKEPEIPVFEEVKSDIIQELQARQSENLFLEKAGRMSELVLDAGSGLESAADETGVEIKTTELFGRSGGTGIAADPNFINAAFSSVVKDELTNSEVINISDTHVAFMQLNEVKESELKPLDEVKESIVNVLKDNKASEKARELANQIKDQYINDGLSIAELATNNELEMQNQTGVTRTGSTLPFNLVKSIFDMGRPAEGETAVDVLDGNDSSVAVVELLAVNDVDVTDVENFDSEAAQLRRNVKNNELQLLINALRENSSVTINETLLSQLTSQ